MELIQAYEFFIARYDNASTIRSYRNIVLPFIHHFGSGTDIKDFNPHHIQDYLNKLSNGRIRHHTTGQPVVANRTENKHSYHRHVKGIKAFFNYLVKFELLERSPADPISAPRPSGKVSNEKAATEDELALLITAAFGDPRDYALIMFLECSGARAGGASNLEIAEVLDDYGNIKMKFEVFEKFSKHRTVKITPECAQAFRIWLAKRPPTPTNAYFFVTKIRDKDTGEYEKLSTEAINGVIRRLAQKAGIRRNLGPHAVRHAFGFRAADLGIAPSITAKMMGHEDVQVTLEHYYPHDDERAFDGFDKIHRSRANREDSPPVIMKKFRQKLRAK